MNKKTKKTRFSFDEVLEKSNFSFSKNLKYFIIAPILIIIVGIVLFCTIGFNLGFDFTGGSIMTIYLNDPTSGSMEYSDQSYSLEENYDLVTEKINKVLSNYDVSLSSIQTTEINIDSTKGYNFIVVNGDAIVIKYQNNVDASEVNEQNEGIRLALLQEFGYIDASATVEDLNSTDYAIFVSGGIMTANATTTLLMQSFIAFFVAFVVALIYILIRFEFTSSFSAFLVIWHDILVTLALLVIFRVQISITTIVALITVICFSINNIAIIFGKIRENLKMSKNLGKIDNKQVADSSVRSTLLRTMITSVVAILLAVFVIIIGVSNVRQVALAILIGIFVSFYSSNFLAPGLWAIAYRPSKRKLAKIAEKEKQKEQKAQYEV